VTPRPALPGTYDHPVEPGADPAAKPLGLRERQRLETRRALVRAGVEVLSRDGYVNGRVEDIAAEVGARRATFYLHFASKVELARELMGKLGRESQEVYRRLDEVENPSWEDLRGWITVTLGYWDRNRAELLVLHEATAVEPELAHEFVRGVREIARAMSRYLSRWSNADQDTAMLRASMFIFQLERFCYFWKLRDEPFADAAAVASLTDSLWLALHPPRSD